jgi:hypothetical protein
MSVVVVISQHLLNVFVQLANKRRFKTKNKKFLCGNFPHEQQQTDVGIQETAS